MGLMGNELLKKIFEIISLRSKCYSILTVDDVSKSKSKGISKNYCKVNHNHEYFKKILFNKLKTSKASYYKISLKDTKLITELQIKDDISNWKITIHSKKRFCVTKYALLWSLQSFRKTTDLQSKWKYFTIYSKTNW